MNNCPPACNNGCPESGQPTQRINEDESLPIICAMCDMIIVPGEQYWYMRVCGLDVCNDCMNDSRDLMY
jgi:hypothetical protein